MKVVVKSRLYDIWCNNAKLDLNCSERFEGKQIQVSKNTVSKLLQPECDDMYIVN